MLYVVGMGPGGRDHMTAKAIEAIERASILQRM